MALPTDNKKRVAAITKILKKLFPQVKIALTYRTPWECMVAVQLSAQCTDKKVNEVTAVLFKKYRSLDDYVRADRKEFEKDIHSTGFYRAKAKNILAAAQMVKHEFGGKLPKTMAEMLRIPGVARKTANVVLGAVYGISEGIAVDTHVRRLCVQWGLTIHNDPVKIERDLMAMVPKSDWLGWSHRVIFYGRTYSPAHKKDHSDEPLAKFYIQK